MSHFDEWGQALRNKGSNFVTNRVIVCYLPVDLGVRKVLYYLING